MEANSWGKKTECHT